MSCSAAVEQKQQQLFLLHPHIDLLEKNDDYTTRACGMEGRGGARSAPELPSTMRSRQPKRLHLANVISGKLSQTWNHFVCAVTHEGGHCKISDSIQICVYRGDLAVVMGMPLRYKKSEHAEWDRIHEWILDCKAPMEQSAKILALLRKKVENPGPLYSR
ncbi:unnamed protein product [Heligmosomoides polygyrus]|uniref:Uncharacterized protein n=1 Tax=Heligmosomoides polygyrus TaxID=6339 RepID=A0A3P7X1Z1_HELPZ|nr:unnamed protein product [Heligmosomoides polygyrus]